MSWFLGGIVFLILGYFTYGRLVERIVGPDDRKTPCVANPYGVSLIGGVLISLVFAAYAIWRGRRAN